MRSAAQNMFMEQVCRQVRGTLADPLPDGALLDAVYALADKHDLAHLLNSGDPRVADRQNQAIWRYEQQSFVLRQIQKTLERAQIPFIPLKGVVLREIYPEAWMRTSADIDLFVRREDCERVAGLFTEHLGYRKGQECDHHIEYRTKSNINIELHYALLPAARYPEAAAVLADIWQHTTPAEGSAFRMNLSDEMFYFYHVAHMLKHFAAGGCGVRAFLDLWLLEHRLPENGERRAALLRRGAIATFADAARRLAEAWFAGAEAAGLEDMEQYVFRGGSFGTREYSVMIRRGRSRSDSDYLWRRLFPPREKMQYDYPVLQSRHWLTPAIWVVRWFRLLRPEKRKKAVRELELSRNADAEQVKELRALMERLEIW